MDDIVIPTIPKEGTIENAIMAHPEELGFPGALSIRNWRVAPDSGLLDIVLLPVDGPVRLVLVEAKAAVAARRGLQGYWPALDVLRGRVDAWL
jgi:hypothetical protein